MDLSITAEPRTALGKQNNKLRKTGLLPAVLYGPGKETVNLQVPAKAFEKVYRAAGENTLVDLLIGEGTAKKVLIHDAAKHYMKDQIIHVDFYEVDLTRKIHAKVSVHYTGISPAVKDLGGILVKSLSELEIEAFPTDLPHSVEIDIERLKTFADHIRVADIDLGDKVKILTNLEETIVSVQPPRTEAELAALEKPTAEEEKAAIEGMAGAEAGEKVEGEAAEGAAPGAEEQKTDASAEPAKAEKPEKKEKQKEEKK